MTQNLDMLERMILIMKVVDAAEAHVGEVILPNASSDLMCAVRELRRRDGRLKETFECK